MYLVLQSIQQGIVVSIHAFCGRCSCLVSHVCEPAEGICLGREQQCQLLRFMGVLQGALAPGDLSGNAPRALVDAPLPPDAIMSNHSSPGGRAELSVSDAAQFPVPAAGSSGAAGPSMGWAASSA